jgi:hypothetical protein
MNHLNIIFPYYADGMWVFDDPRTGLVEEPFVKGAEEFIEMFAAEIPNSRNGFKLVFSGAAFPGCQVAVRWERPEHGGHWYSAPGLDIKGWLSPSMMKYFDYVPALIFVQASPKG